MPETRQGPEITQGDIVKEAGKNAHYEALNTALDTTGLTLGLKGGVDYFTQVAEEAEDRGGMTKGEGAKEAAKAVGIGLGTTYMGEIAPLFTRAVVDRNQNYLKDNRESYDRFSSDDYSHYKRLLADMGSLAVAGTAAYLARHSGGVAHVPAEAIPFIARAVISHGVDNARNALHYARVDIKHRITRDNYRLRTQGAKE